MNKHDWVVNVDEDVANMEDYPKEIEQPRKTSIYKVPDHINDKNSKAYKPQVVSLGPYHHGEENLKPMEVHKYRAFLHFLKRSQKPAELYWDALVQEVNDLRDAYDQLDSVWLEDDNKFLQMMIIDGCFILEILREFTCRSHSYSPNDPIFSVHGRLNRWHLIRVDMLLLENQVPLRVLEILVAVEGGSNTMRTSDFGIITHMLFCFCRGTLLKSQSIIIDDFNSLHILDVYRRTLLAEQPKPMDDKRKQNTTTECRNSFIPYATELQEAGIQFKTSETKSLKDISFKGSTLFFPPIVVHGGTESLFLNLIAFERLHVGAGNDITSYVFFMRSLIMSGRDASLLRSLDIVHNGYGSDEDVAQLFKSISRGVTFDVESELGIVYSEVITILRKRFRKMLSAWRMDLLQNYFKSPWGVLSVIAAIILFTLTSIQTVYTVMSYNHAK